MCLYNSCQIIFVYYTSYIIKKLRHTTSEFKYHLHENQIYKEWFIAFFSPLLFYNWIQYGKCIIIETAKTNIITNRGLEWYINEFNFKDGWMDGWMDA